MNSPPDQPDEAAQAVTDLTLAVLQAPDTYMRSQLEHFLAGLAPGGKQGGDESLELLLGHGLVSVLRQDLHLPQVPGSSSPSFLAPLKLGNRQVAIALTEHRLYAKVSCNSMRKRGGQAITEGVGMGRAFRRETGLPLLIGFALGVSLAAPNLAAAGPTCHGNGTCPNMSPNGRYFSGTLGTMKCRWSAGTGDRLSKVQAFVNGALRFENVWPPPRGPVVFPPQGRPEMPIGYSTTQFPDGTQLTFKTCVWTVNGQYAESTDPTVHYTLNRGYALTNDDPNLQQTSDDRALAASLFMYTANHSSTFGLCGKGTITGTAIPRSTFYHITTHGASDSVGDSYARPGGDPNHWITAAEVTAAIATKGNSDCQFNFVFLDACDTGDGGNTIYGPWNTESYVGWSGVMRDTTPYLHFVQYLYSNLAAQETVADAVRYAKGQPQTAQNAQWFGVGSYQVHHTY